MAYSTNWQHIWKRLTGYSSFALSDGQNSFSVDNQYKRNAPFGRTKLNYFTFRYWVTDQFGAANCGSRLVAMEGAAAAAAAAAANVVGREITRIAAENKRYVGAGMKMYTHCENLYR